MVISGIGLIGPNAVIELIGGLGALEDAWKCSGLMQLMGPSLSGFIETFYALIAGTIALDSYRRDAHMQNEHTSRVNRTSRDK